MDPSVDPECHAEPASEGGLHVHVHPKGGPVHPDAIVYGNTGRRRQRDAQAAPGL